MKPTGNPPNAEYRRFESNREYEEIVDRMIPLTQRIIRNFDKTLSPAWNGSARIELLRQFLLTHRSNRLLIVLHDTRTLHTVHPRLLALARQFSHACVIRETLRSAKHASDPFVIFDGSHYVHRFHHDHMRAAQGTHDAVGAGQLIERFSEIEEASGPPLATSVTGL
ncbi:MAG: hypothetical protein KF771_07730 [Burkholderiales bacterium]|nr:hypothetical protein [Burkholderiales bacterium]